LLFNKKKDLPKGKSSVGLYLMNPNCYNTHLIYKDKRDDGVVSEFDSSLLSFLKTLKSNTLLHVSVM
jgi:hypothetical protein